MSPIAKAVSCDPLQFWHKLKFIRNTAIRVGGMKINGNTVIF